MYFPHQLYTNSLSTAYYAVLTNVFTRDCSKTYQRRWFSLEMFKIYPRAQILTVSDATDAETPTNSTSPRPECKWRRFGSGFGPNPGKQKITLYFACPSNPGTRARTQHFRSTGNQYLYRGHIWNQQWHRKAQHINSRSYRLRRLTRS